MATEIQAGARLPDAPLFTSATPPVATTVHRQLLGKRWLVVAVPGAFTPGCTRVHLPGFVASAPQLRAAFNVEGIAFVSANDGFVMEAWGHAHNADKANVTMLADPTCEWGKRLGFTQAPPFAGPAQLRYRRLV